MIYPPMLVLGSVDSNEKMDPLKMYFLLKIGISDCYVSLPEGNTFSKVSK